MQKSAGGQVHWKWNVLAYVLWIVAAFLIWAISYLSTYYVPISMHFPIPNPPFWMLVPILEALSSWLILRTLIADQRLPWLIVITFVGYFLGIVIEGNIYAFVYHLLSLAPGHTVRMMFMTAIMSILVITVTIAILQALFLGPILKRVNRGFIVSWIAAAVVAGIAAPAVSVLFQLLYYSPSYLYPSLIQNVLLGIVAGLPLLWLKARQQTS